MNTVMTIFAWDHRTNIATFHFTDCEPVSVRMDSFEEAQSLSSAIQHELRLARYTGRMELLDEIRRIKP